MFISFSCSQPCWWMAARAILLGCCTFVDLRIFADWGDKFQQTNASQILCYCSLSLVNLKMYWNNYSVQNVILFGQEKSQNFVKNHLTKRLRWKLSPSPRTPTWVSDKSTTPIGRFHLRWFVRKFETQIGKSQNFSGGLRPPDPPEICPIYRFNSTSYKSNYDIVNQWRVFWNLCLSSFQESIV